MSSTGLVGVLGAVVVIGVVLRLVVRRRLLVKYAALWLLVSVVLVVMALIPHSLTGLADLLGFVVPANLLFFAGFVLLLFVTVQISVELTKVERRLQRLAEELAIMKESGRGEEP
jgi:hypothetical protein